MQERRTAERFRTNLNTRWESLRGEGRGSICDFSLTGCFVLTGGEVAPRELIRLEVAVGDQIISVWGNVVYQVREMGFAIRFAVATETERQNLIQLTAAMRQD
jgi:hypothetical protein